MYYVIYSKFLCYKYNQKNTPLSRKKSFRAEMMLIQHKVSASIFLPVVRLPIVSGGSR